VLILACGIGAHSGGNFVVLRASHLRNPRPQRGYDAY
jgi:hypothetical protein